MRTDGTDGEGFERILVGKSDAGVVLRSPETEDAQHIDRIANHKAPESEKDKQSLLEIERNQVSTLNQHNSFDSVYESDNLLDMATLGLSEIMGRALINALPNLVKGLINLSAGIVLNQVSTQETNAQYGMSLIFRPLLVQPFFYSCQTLLMIAASQYLGEAIHINKVKVVFAQMAGVYLFYMVLLYLPIAYCQDFVLVWFGIRPELASGVKLMLLKVYAADLLEGLAVIVAGFCYSQKIEKIFILINWGSALLAVPPTLVLLKYGYAFDGWLIGNTLFFVFQLTGSIYVFLTQTNPETRGIPDFSEILHDLVDRCKNVLLFFFAAIVEALAWEIGTSFNALGNSSADIAAYSSVLNLSSFISNISHGSIITPRTYFNQLLGASHPRSAKRIATKMSISGFLIALVIGICLFSFNEQIADVFASNQAEHRALLVQLLVFYSILVQADMHYPGVALLCRSTNHVLFSSAVYAIISIGLHACLCYYLRYIYLTASCVHFFLAQYGTLFLSNAVCLAKVLAYDWRHVALINK